MSLSKRKLIFQSDVLGREVHADVLETAPEPSWTMLFFGGSGMTREKYEARRETMITSLDDALAATSLSFRFVFVSAPFDVPFARMSEEAPEAELWVEHVEEIIDRFPHGPVYLAAFSGGVRLALTGAQHLNPVVGAGAVGADGLDRGMDTRVLSSPPLFVYHHDDPVLARNRSAAQALGRLRLRGHGGHEFGAYVEQVLELAADAIDILSADGS